MAPAIPPAFAASSLETKLPIRHSGVEGIITAAISSSVLTTIQTL